MRRVDPAARTAAITRAVLRALHARDWAPVTEFPLPDGRRADILALTPGGDVVIVEVKSGLPDLRADAKWPSYAAWCDSLYFAVDADFPAGRLPDAAGVIVAAGGDAAILRPAPTLPLAPARRRALTLRAARLAAARLFALSDPAGAAEARAALRLA